MDLVEHIEAYLQLLDEGYAQHELSVRRDIADAKVEDVPVIQVKCANGGLSSLFQCLFKLRFCLFLFLHDPFDLSVPKTDFELVDAGLRVNGYRVFHLQILIARVVVGLS